MRVLPNAETRWERSSDLQQFSEQQVEARIGASEEPLSLLSGGLANLNIRVGEGRVLRIYRRDAKELPKEAALLDRGWESFRSPQVYEQGSDFLLLEYIPHGPLPDSAASGLLVGKALAEIHGREYPVHGDFDAAGIVHSPMPDFPHAIRSHAKAEIGKGPSEFHPLAEVAYAHLDARYERLGEFCKRPTRLHGDFKASNLHLAKGGGLLVLDWEFAYAGPPLMDVGQLLRWSPSESFLEGFAEAYRGGGRHLPEDWRRIASDFDLANLAGLLGGSEPGSRRAADVAARIRESLGLTS